ncbi:S66 peptidase family protein [Aureitalea marina]|uniref:LD-carboxypeptidase n=1 Tax=Aureitalea marina TaxID=930804 RepID=A0A2S7KRP5_9FLAO|nr:LD-carboxypeptidase [Aureitalea marina]PQB05277.1 LD-carboxypeptidase [Aureitalea marina]
MVSTARKITTSQVKPLLDLLEQWELQPVLGMTINAEDNQYAGDDELRAKDLQQMLDNQNIKAIWCARGGYGTVRVVDKVDFSGFAENPKWLIGYSDVTVLHSEIHNLGIKTLHANMATEIDTKSEATRSTAKRSLFGQSLSIASKSTFANRPGSARGTLVGGNLSILYSLCGSKTAIDTSGKILFIEDLDEYLYHVDRMMMNIKRNGMLDNLKALIVGGMSDMKDNTIPFGKSAKEIVWDAVKEYDYPVCFDFPAGHIRDNQAMIMGGQASLEVASDSFELTF